MTATAFPYRRPAGNAAATVLATDITLAASSYGNILAVTFTPRATSVIVRVAGVYSMANGAVKCSFRISGDNSAGTKQIGSPIGSASQVPFAGIAVYTGLKPGTAYTFTAQANSNAGNFLCRASVSAGDEIWAMTAEDAL